MKAARTSSELCPMAAFGVSDAALSDSAIIVSVNHNNKI
jgi:hypothetical protein